MLKILAACCVPTVGLLLDVCGVDLPVTPENGGLVTAIENVRSLRRRGELAAGQTVRLLLTAGRYRLSKPIVLTPSDSGLQIVGREFGETVIDGGRELTPFIVGADGIWETSVPKGLEFNQLWVGGRRAIRARTPNRGFFYMRDRDEEFPKRAFLARKEDVSSLVTLDADSLNRVLCAYWESWDMGYDTIKSLDLKNGRLVMRKGSMWNLFHWGSCPRYRLENFRAALDVPGEWFHDIKRGKLLYLPRLGETPETVSAVVPVIESLIVLRGDWLKGELVKNLVVRDISFEYAAYKPGIGAMEPGQAALSAESAAILADGAENVVFENVRVSHCGAIGVWFRRGCKDMLLAHALVEDLGCGGVYIGDTGWDKDRREHNTANVKVSDSIIRHGGRYNNGAVGVWIGHAHDCAIVHNEIADFYYTGVSAGWTWGYKETCNRNNKISFNHIRDIGQGRQSDMGGIYLLGDSRGTEVCNNWIHDVNGYLYSGSPAWGLYADEGSYGIVFSSNLVERCRTGVVHHHYGKENVCVNNIFAFFGDCGVRRSSEETHVSMRLENNIFWWTDTNAVVYGSSPEGLPTDNNVYWRTNGNVAGRLFGDMDFVDWQRSGNDLNGVVLDPQFVDAAHGDWRLRPTSPALIRGFVPFDWTEAGVLKTNAAWRAKAAERTAETFVDEKPPVAPRHLVEKADFDAEGLGIGPMLNVMDGLKPFHGVPGLAGTLSVTNRDGAEGCRARVFPEVEGLKASWQPHVFLPCLITGGVAVVRFACKFEKGASMAMELRDGVSKPGSQVTGVTVACRNGMFTAGNKNVCEVPPETWTGVELRLPLNGPEAGRWKCIVKVRGSESKSIVLEGWQNKDFAAITWLGFMSYGEIGTSWALDAFRLGKQNEMSQ